MEENKQDIFRRLTQPFQPEELEWRIVHAGVTNNNPWAKVVCYVTARAIENRLDKVLGNDNWEPHYTQIDGGFLCHLKLRINGEWITKTDGANNTNIEPIKGGISDALKRAAVQWGPGRYLYQLEETWAKCTLVSSQRDAKDNCHAHKDKKTGTQYYINWETPHLPAWAVPRHDDGGYSNKISEAGNLQILKEVFKEAVKFAQTQNNDDLKDQFVKLKDQQKQLINKAISDNRDRSNLEVERWLKDQVKVVSLVPDATAKAKVLDTIEESLNKKCQEFGLNPEHFQQILKGE